MTSSDAWMLVDPGRQDTLISVVWKIATSGDPIFLRQAQIQEALVSSGCSFATIFQGVSDRSVLLAGSATGVVKSGNSTIYLKCPDGVTSTTFQFALPLESVELAGGDLSDEAAFPIHSGVARASKLTLRWNAPSVLDVQRSVFPISTVAKEVAKDLPSQIEEASTDESGTVFQEFPLSIPQASTVPQDSVYEADNSGGDDIGRTRLPAETLTYHPDLDNQLSRNETAGDAASETAISPSDGTPGLLAGDVPGHLANDDFARPSVEADGTTDSYDELFGLTVPRTIEGAAVRADQLPESDAGEERQVMMSQSEPEGSVIVVADVSGESVPGVHQVVEVSSPVTGIIDSIPWARRPDLPESDVPEIKSNIDAGNLGNSGDQDVDMTVSRATQSALIHQLSSGSLGPASPMVHAVRCKEQHANPAHAVVCRICASPIPPQSALMVPRPILGRLRLSTGDDVILDRAVIMGRDPAKDRQVAGERPHVVKLSGADISRSHLEVVLDEWHVLVTDLNSTNGTVVTLPGRLPERLRPGQAIMIEPGTVVSLAEELHFTYEAS